MAKKYYKKIVDYLESDKTLEGEEKEKCNSLLLAGHLNLAMCCLKLGQDHDAMDHCDKALELDPKSEKGLFRRGSVSGLCWYYKKIYQENVLLIFSHIP